MTTIKQWGKIISAARRKLGLTQQGLATAMDVSASTVEAWERGVRNILPEDLVRLVRMLGIDSGKLFDEPPQQEVGVV